MTPDQIEFWIRVIGFVLSIGAIVFTFFRTRREDVDERFKTGSERMDRHEARISKMEQTVQSLPDKDDVHAMQLEMVKQTGSLNEIRAVMDGNSKIMARLEAIVSRHEDHLLEGAKGK